MDHKREDRTPPHEQGSWEWVDNNNMCLHVLYVFNVSDRFLILTSVSMPFGSSDCADLHTLITTILNLVSTGSISVNGLDLNYSPELLHSCLFSESFVSTGIQTYYHSLELPI